MPRLMGTRKKSRISTISDKRIRNNDRLTGNLTPSIIPSADEIREKYGFMAKAIVTMEEVVEHLYGRNCQGRVLIDDTLKAAIDEYYKTYGVKS